jgi:RNA polymerase sigma-70 factor (ECF subfamily)
MKTKCRPYIERLCNALGEDLNSPLCRELQEHIAQCPECTLQVNTVRRTVEIYQTFPCSRIPGDVEKRLRAVLHIPLLEVSSKDQL